MDLEPIIPDITGWPTADARRGRALVIRWVERYNTARLHSAIGYQPTNRWSQTAAG